MAALPVPLLGGQLTLATGDASAAEAKRLMTAILAFTDALGNRPEVYAPAAAVCVSLANGSTWVPV